MILKFDFRVHYGHLLQKANLDFYKLCKNNKRFPAIFILILNEKGDILKEYMSFQCKETKK